MLDVNVKGAWLCAKAAVPLLREAGGGSIVNMASEVAFSGSPGLAHYVTSKAAIIGLTRVLARELGPARIRVNALAPGFIPTEGSATMTRGRGVRRRPDPARPARAAGRPARRARLPDFRRERVHHRPDAAGQRRPAQPLTLRGAAHPNRVMTRGRRAGDGRARGRRDGRTAYPRRAPDGTDGAGRRGVRVVTDVPRQMVRIAWRDPEHICERLTLQAVHRLAEPSLEWAQAARAEHPDGDLQESVETSARRPQGSRACRAWSPELRSTSRSSRAT